MRKRILILETNADGDAVRILRSVSTLSEAANDARAIEATEGALATLSGPELVAMYNAQVKPEDHVERFADRKAGAKRVLEAWMAEDIVPPPPEPVPPATKSKRAKKAKRKGHSTVSKAGRPVKELAGTLHIIPAKCEGKRWRPGSERYAAFRWIEAHDGVSTQKFAEAIGAKAMALLGKILETGCVELTVP